MLHTLNKQYGINVWIPGYSVASIGVSLFILISGYLLLDKEENMKDFFTKRVFSILPLFIGMNLIYKIFNKFIFEKRVEPSHFWYIYMILGLYLLTPWLRKVLKYLEKETFFVLVLWFFVNVLNPYLLYFHFWKFNLSNFPITGFLGYYLIGYYVKKYKSKIVKYNNFKIFLIYLTGFLISFLTTKYIFIKTGEKLTIFFDKNALGTFIMSVSFFVFFVKIEFKSRNKVIKTLANATYFAYLIHLIVLKYVVMISDEMIFKSVATVVISLVLGILWNQIENIFKKMKSSNKIFIKV